MAGSTVTVSLWVFNKPYKPLHGGHPLIPSWALWALLIGLVFVACFQAWLDAYRKSQSISRQLDKLTSLGHAPLVTIAYDASSTGGPWSDLGELKARRSKPIILANTRDAEALNVQVCNIVRGGYVARFPFIGHLVKGQEAQVLPTISGPTGDLSGIEEHALVKVLQSGWDWDAALRQEAHLARIPVYIEYEAANGKTYQTEHEIIFDHLRQSSKIVFIRICELKDTDAKEKVE